MLHGAYGWGCAILVRLAIDYVQPLLLGISDQNRNLGIFHAQTTLNILQILCVPTLVGLFLGLCYHYLIPTGRPQGVADIIKAHQFLTENKTAQQHYESHYEGNRFIPRKIWNHAWVRGLIHTPLHVLSLAGGASSGREGPVVFVAASLSESIGKAFHLNPEQKRSLIGAGVAAAVAASFNAPIAGVFFALEVVIGDYALVYFAPVVLASVSATLFAQSVFNGDSLFDISSHQIVSLWEFPAFAILGVLSSFAALLLIKGIGWTESIHQYLKIKAWLRPAIAGLFLGMIGLVFPEVLGVGHGFTNALLHDHFAIWMLFALLLVKGLATALTLGSGFGGGIFSPSMVVGALLGSFFGSIATLLLPHLSSGVSAYALIGMGAVAGAMLGAPISTILIIFELTGDYRMTLAVMIATVISSQLLLSYHGVSFFHWQISKWKHIGK